MERKVDVLRKKIQEKRKEIEAKNADLEAFVVKREQGGTVTEEEVATFNAGNEEIKRMEAELVAIDRELKTEENVEQVNIRRAVGAPANTGHSAGDAKDLKKFSLQRAVVLSNPDLKRQAGNNFDFGFEEEMAQEFVREQKSAGLPSPVSESPNVGIPSMVISSMAMQEIRRDMAVNTPSDGTKGGLLVDETTENAIIRLFRNMNNWRGLGARINTGLTTNWRFISETAYATANWEGETDLNELTDAAFTEDTMSPHRLSASTIYSRMLAIQANPNIEKEMRSQLFEAMDDKLMETAINGTGIGDVPLGLLASGITTLNTTTNANDGAALTYDLLVDLEGRLDIDNAWDERISFLGNSKIRQQLKKAKIDAGSGLLVMTENNRLMGYNYQNTNFVPSNIAKGTSGSVLSALILGYFPDFMISQWGGFSLITDPYSKARNSQIQITVDSFWDMKVRRKKSFVCYKDVKA